MNYEAWFVGVIIGLIVMVLAGRGFGGSWRELLPGVTLLLGWAIYFGLQLLLNAPRAGVIGLDVIVVTGVLGIGFAHDARHASFSGPVRSSELRDHPILRHEDRPTSIFRRWAPAIWYVPALMMGVGATVAGSWGLGAGALAAAAAARMRPRSARVDRGDLSRPNR